jgi:hypothetical protein
VHENNGNKRSTHPNKEKYRKIGKYVNSCCSCHDHELKITYEKYKPIMLGEVHQFILTKYIVFIMVVKNHLPRSTTSNMGKYIRVGKFKFFFREVHDFGWFNEVHTAKIGE